MANTAVVYGRDYAGKTLNFEPSGGLKNASLVMQDQQTDTYWSLMQGKALTGALAGETLQELSVGEKVTWKQWRQKHPNTKVLSVDGQEDGKNVYRGYFNDKSGFRGLQATDQRLKTKTPVYAFHRNGQAFAVSFESIMSGASFALPGGGEMFLYRDQRDDVLRSTAAFLSTVGFTKKNGQWQEDRSGEKFDSRRRNFAKGAVEPIGGFDTYWYNWSLNNPDTRFLQAEPTTSSNREAVGSKNGAQ